MKSLSPVFLIVLSELCFSQDSRPPSLVHQLKSTYAIDPSATPYFTECEFRGRPDPIVTWTLDGNSIPSSRTSKGPYYRTDGILVLREARPSDSGIYTCTATNSLGSLNVTTRINIEEPYSVPLWEEWWMLFVYAAAAWVLSTSCLLAIFLYRYRTTRVHPKPMGRDEVDHETPMHDQRRPGYANPAYDSNSMERNRPLTTETPIELVDGTPTRTTSFAMASFSDRGGEVRTSGRRKSSNSAFVDVKLQLIEVKDDDSQEQSSRNTHDRTTVHDLTTTDSQKIARDLTTADNSTMVHDPTTTDSSTIARDLTTADNSTIARDLTTADSRTMVQDPTTANSSTMVHDLTTTDSSTMVHDLTTADSSTMVHDLTTADNSTIARDLTTTDSRTMVHDLTTADNSTIARDLTTADSQTIGTTAADIITADSITEIEPFS